MNFHFSEQQLLLKDIFGKLFLQESNPAKVRAAEATGFDRELWEKLVETGAVTMRGPEELGGVGTSLLDAVLVAEEAGRNIASAPLIESIVATKLLAAIGSGQALTWFEKVRDGEKILTIALQPVSEARPQTVPAATVADGVIWLDGDVLRLSGIEAGPGDAVTTNIGTLPVKRLAFEREGSVVLGTGSSVVLAYRAAIEEWKLLVASTLVGVTEEALKLAAVYSNERTAFGKAIGSFQGVSHPLADSITDCDGARLLIWRAVWAIATGRADAGALISLAYWFATQTVTRATTRAIRVFGGYGMSLEYDIQIFFRRGRAWSLLLGDPAEELRVAGDRLWGDAEVSLPDAGSIEMDFGWGADSEEIAADARRFFETHLTQDLRNFAYTSDDAHHPEFFQKLAAQRLLYPEWPTEYQGRACDLAEAAAVHEVFNEFDWPILVPVVTDMVGKMLLEFGSEQARRDILPGLADGTAYCSLGYSEPSGGSDLFAAKTTAVRDGDDWVINGQKMFTTQGHLADYALMIVRTDPTLAKHAGLTLFVVPLRQPGYESHHVKTIGHERTNITYYTDMRVPDAYRLGEVNGGTKVMSAALKLEQGVGLYNVGPLRRVLKHAIAWAKKEPGRLENREIRARLARISCAIDVADALTKRSIWAQAEGISQKWYGSMSKLFGSEAWLSATADMMELAAPDTIFQDTSDTGWIEIEYRRAVPSTIYGGTSEIHRSIIAESALKMPRSRV